MIIGFGTFSGAGGHKLEGSFTLTRQKVGILMQTSPDFFFDGATSPQWSLSKGVPTDIHDPDVKATAVETQFGSLPGEIQIVRGTHTAMIDPETELKNYDTVFLWCSAMPYILGTGQIKRVAP